MKDINRIARFVTGCRQINDIMKTIYLFMGITLAGVPDAIAALCQLHWGRGMLEVALLIDLSGNLFNLWDVMSA